MTLGLAPRVPQVFQNWFSMANAGRFGATTLSIYDTDRRQLIYTGNTFHIFYCSYNGSYVLLLWLPHDKRYIIHGNTSYI